MTLGHFVAPGRIEAKGPVELSKRLVETSHQTETIAKPRVRENVTRVQFNGTLESPFRGLEVVVIPHNRPG